MANPSLIITATDQASPAIARVRGSLDELLRSFGGFGAQAGKLSVPLLGVSAAIVGIGAAVSNALNVTRWVDELADSGSALGVSAENMAKYQILAKQAGIEANTLGTAFTTLAKNIEGAKAGEAAQVDLFRRLGISAKELRELNFDEALVRVAKAFTELASGTAKSTLQLEAYGKAGKQIDDMNQKLASGQQVNTGLTKDFIQQTQKLNKELDEVSIAWERYKILLAGPVVDALMLVAKWTGLATKSVEDQRKGLLNTIDLAEQRLTEQRRAQESAGTRPWDQKSFERQEARLGQLREELRLLDEAAERGSPRDAPGLRQPPPPEDPEAARRAKSAAERFRKEGEEIAKEQREMALRIQAATAAATERVQDANDRRRERERAAQKEWDDGALERARKIEDLLTEIYNKGQEERQKKQAEQIKLVEDQIEKVTDVTESFFLKLTEFEGVDIFKTLAKDLAQLAYRMLVLEPLLNNIRTVMKDMANTVPSGSTGEGWIGMLMKVFGITGTGATASGATYPSGFDAQLGGPLIGPTLVGEAGPEIVIPHHRTGSAAMGNVSIVQNNTIDSRSDIGTISAMLEMNKQSTLRAVREQLARRSPNLRV